MLDQVKEDMELFIKVFDENRVFAVMLKNPVILHSKKRAVLNAIFSEKMNKLTVSAFDLITKKNRENILDTVAHEFLAQYNILKGIQKATITATYELDEKEKARFSKMVESLSGKKSELEVKVDKSIVGGFIMNIGDKQLDESVKSKLNKIHRELTA